MVAFFLSMTSLFMVGPSHLMSLPKSKGIVFAGYFFLSLSYTLIVTSSMPELLRATHLATGINISD